MSIAIGPAPSLRRCIFTAVPPSLSTILPAASATERNMQAGKSRGLSTLDFPCFAKSVTMCTTQNVQYASLLVMRNELAKCRSVARDDDEFINLTSACLFGERKRRKGGMHRVFSMPVSSLCETIGLWSFL